MTMEVLRISDRLPDSIVEDTKPKSSNEGYIRDLELKTKVDEAKLIIDDLSKIDIVDPLSHTVMEGGIVEFQALLKSLNDTHMLCYAEAVEAVDLYDHIKHDPVSEQTKEYVRMYWHIPCTLSSAQDLCAVTVRKLKDATSLLDVYSSELREYQKYIHQQLVEASNLLSDAYHSQKELYNSKEKNCPIYLEQIPGTRWPSQLVNTKEEQQFIQMLKEIQMLDDWIVKLPIATMWHNMMSLTMATHKRPLFGPHEIKDDLTVKEMSEHSSYNSPLPLSVEERLRHAWTEITIRGM